MPYKSHRTSFPLLSPPDHSWTPRPRPRSQFRLLAAHFAQEILSIGQGFEANEPEIGAAAILAILAVPGTIYSLLLFEKYSTFLRILRGGHLHIDVYLASLPDKYLFIVCSMTLTALVVALKWERILPGRLDHAILAPLPIRLRTVFLANTAALAFLAVVFAVDLNAVSTVLFPLVVLSDENVGLAQSLRFILVHGACVALASAFVFCGCLGVLGMLMSSLQPLAFKRVSLFVRLGIVFGSFLLLWTTFQVPSLMRSPSATDLLVWLPSAWYVALYQCMQGHATPELRALAYLALDGMLVAFTMAIAGMVLSYRRYFMRVSESAKSIPVTHRWRFAWGRNIVNRLVFRNGFERAVYWFGLRLLLRSEPHFIAFGTFLTAGLVIGSEQALAGPSWVQEYRVPVPVFEGMLTASLSVAYLVVVGFRAVLEIPAGANAAWVYKLCLITPDPRSVLRKLNVTLLALIVVIPTALILAFALGTSVVFLHAVYVLAVSVVLSDCVLMKFRRIPFASALPRFEDRSVLLIALYTLGFLLFTTVATKIEIQMLRYRLSFIGLPILLALWYIVLTWRQRQDESDPDSFPSDTERTIQTLGIDS